MRGTIARQSDVEKSSVKMEIEPGDHDYRIGIISFAAKKGKSIDLQKLQESIRATRLGRKTSSEVKYLEITAEGELVVAEKEVLLKVRGGEQRFLLSDDPAARGKEGEKTPYERLMDALAKGKKIASVTGRLPGWSGRWPDVLRELAEKARKDAGEPDKVASKKPTQLIVKDFQIAEE